MTDDVIYVRKAREANCNIIYWPDRIPLYNYLTGDIGK